LKSFHFQKSGIDKLFPNAKIFDYLFEPCGYSMNGLLPNGHYFTIHITPEPDFSYVSFETNVSYHQYQELIRQILIMFNPGKFTTTIFGGTVRKPSYFSQLSLIIFSHRQQQVWIVNVNYFYILIMLVLIIKLFACLISILSIVIIKSIQAKDYATPSTCVK
jgi:hypothetical protein